MILVATVAPADIKYPTDIHLLNKCREHLETAINVLWKVVPHTGHKLPYSAKKARKAYLKLAKSKKWTKAKCRKGIGEQLRSIELATKRLHTLKEQVPSYRKQLAGWLLRRLEVIPLVYLQQKEMYDNNTHTCKDRIVSLEQPCWNNFNEALDLKAAVQNYHRRHGFYPSAVLADRIYQTRANKMYCKKRGIRLSGPPLGRRKAGDTEAKMKRQMYKDSCERNAIEGRIGTGKRRFGLDLIMSKLDETAKTEAVMDILAMNVSRRLVRWLAYLFRFRWILGGYVVFQ